MLQRCCSTLSSDGFSFKGHCVVPRTYRDFSSCRSEIAFFFSDQDIVAKSLYSSAVTALIELTTSEGFLRIRYFRHRS